MSCVGVAGGAPKREPLHLEAMLPAIVRRGIVLRERLGARAESLPLRDAVHVEHSLAHVQRVAGYAHRALDDDRRGIVGRERAVGIRNAVLRRRLVDDDAAALRSGEAGELEIRERNVRSVRQLIDEEKIAHEQRRLHALRRDVVGGNQEDADEEEDRDGAGERRERAAREERLALAAGRSRVCHDGSLRRGAAVALLGCHCTGS